MRRERARIRKRRELGAGLFGLWLEVSEADDVKPGQFFQFATAPRFLRRALSVADRQANRLLFVLRVVGAGTRWLAARPQGTELDILGPLGQGVEPPRDARVMLLGGGVGAAPLLYLARTLAAGGCSTDAVIAAARADELVLLEEFNSLCRRVNVVTEDGSRGMKGRLTDVLHSLPDINEAEVVYACGPEPMLAALKRLALPQPVYAFLESRMGCGTGLCVGCGVRGQDGRYRRVCTDGPVFKLSEIEL